MSWFACDSSPQQATGIDTSVNHCNYSGRRLCTAAEVCPSSPSGQSVAGVTGGSLTKALLVVGDAFVDAATCQRLSQISSYTVDGFLCCPTGDLPRPKDFVSDGEWRMCGNYSPPQNTTLLYVNKTVQDKQPSKLKWILRSDWQPGWVKWFDVARPRLPALILQEKLSKKCV